MGESSEDQKDIAQDIYLKTFNKLSGFKFQSKLSTWIGQITYNTCLTYLEKKKLVLLNNKYDEQETNEETLEILSNKSPGTLTNETETLIFRKELSGILQLEIA